MVEPVRFRTARQESFRLGGAEVAGFGRTRPEDAQGAGAQRCPKAWVTPRLRSWALELHRTGSGKLAPRKPASNSPDIYLFDSLRAAHGRSSRRAKGALARRIQPLACW
ncbi:hypothetical protein GCM10018775_74510 [Streptomyces umbrinus]|nr:hypothetical protein GCM10018775_74510 [Streptomyces umbrinus]